MTEKKAVETEQHLGIVQETRKTRKAFPKPCVYCGPSVHGVARQYTVYSGDVPQALEEFLAQHPAARGLMVSVEGFAGMRRSLETAGTREAALYQKVKAELQEGGK